MAAIKLVFRPNPPEDLASNRRPTQSIQLTPTPSSPTCKLFKFPDDIGSWDTSLYQPLKDGFFRPLKQEETGFPAPEIWLVPRLSVLFQAVEFRAAVKAEQPSGPATLIITLGKKLKVFRFLIGDGSPQVVGFERTTPDGFKRVSPANTLSHAPEANSTLVVTVESKHSGGSEIAFTFDVAYQTATGQSVTDTFPYTVWFADPNPADLGSEYAFSKFGFGVYEGSVVRPISFDFCPN